MKRILLLAFFSSVVSLGTLIAQDFTYQPKNPAFGGNVLNYNWMLSSANAQNTIEAPEQDDPFSSRFNRDPLTDFQENLNRQILNQLSRNLVSNQFGEEGLEEGSYQIGNFQIDVTEELDGISVQILDSGTGDQTSVFIPFY